MRSEKYDEDFEEEEDFNRERDEDIRERKRIMRTLSMASKSQNDPRMPQAIIGKRKYQHNRGELDEDKIKKRM